MKTITNYHGKAEKTLALFLALFIAFMIAWCVPLSSKAHADEEGNPHVCTSDCYTDIYYFSDSGESAAYGNMFLNAIVAAYGNTHTVFNGYHYYNTDSNDFFNEFIAGQGFLEIENSLIIYEQRGRFYRQIIDGANPHAQIDFLYNAFSVLKGSNCKIMFICGTDEEFFAENDNNELLDYVDIHVNIDMFSYFIDTFFQIYFEKGLSTTIIVDKSLSVNCTNDYTSVETNVHNEKYFNTGDFCNYILPSYLRRYCDMSFLNGFVTISDMLQQLNLNVLCHTGDDRNGNHVFYDMRSRIEYTYTDEEGFIDWYFADRYCFLGTTRLGDNSYVLDGMLRELTDTLGIEDMWDTYMYIENGCYDPTAVEGYPCKYLFGLDRYQTAAFLQPIMYDFIMGNDLQPYDNWDGRCEITCKSISAGDGWVRGLSDIAKWALNVAIPEDDAIDNYGAY